jgi:hypothetical protein
VLVLIDTLMAKYRPGMHRPKAIPLLQAMANTRQHCDKYIIQSPTSWHDM